MEDLKFRSMALCGFFIISFVAWISGSKDKINKKTILVSILIAWTLGGLTFWLPWTRDALNWINNILIAVLQASQKGTIFLFGPLAISPGQILSDGTPSIGFVLAIQVLPSIIFFSAFVSALYYLKIMQTCVHAFARFFQKTMSLSGAESLSASANLFVGIESCLTVRPYLNKMSHSELLTLMTCMMATVASTVMAVYVIALKDVFPNIAGHLISASLISIPCAVLISKLSIPEVGQPQTMGAIPNRALNPEFDNDTKKQTNLMVALIDGGMQGVKLAVGIASLLIIVLGLEEIFNLILGYLPNITDAPITMTRIFGWFTLPFTILIGLRPDEWELGSQILGSRFVETEVTAYFQLAALQAQSVPAFSLRSLTILTYSLCGFVHIASLGIFIGGMIALVPSRAKEISIIGLRALWASFLATLLTGCIAGVLS